MQHATDRAFTSTFAPGRQTEGRSIVARLRLWLDLWSERRTLASLDRRMLADLGIDHAQAMHEAGRPMWDIPRDRDYGGRFGLDR